MKIGTEKWEELAKKLQKEEAIMGYRNTAENLKNLYEKKHAVVISSKGGEVIAFGGLWNTLDEHCLEAGSFWVHDDYRGNGYSSEMFLQLSKLIAREKIALCISHNKKVVHLLVKNGWVESTKENWDVKIPFRVSCGPCEVVPEEEKKKCFYKADKEHCRMFLKEG